MFRRKINEVELRKNQELLLAADVFKGQWTVVVKKRVSEKNREMVPVPKNMTHIFQPLDLTVNRSAYFTTTYTSMGHRSKETTTNWS